MRKQQQRPDDSGNADRDVRSQWLTIDEAAAYLNTSRRFIERLVAQRRVPFSKMGKFVRLQREDLDAFAEAGRVEAMR